MKIIKWAVVSLLTLSGTAIYGQKQNDDIWTLIDDFQPLNINADYQDLYYYLDVFKLQHVINDSKKYDALKSHSILMPIPDENGSIGMYEVYINETMSDGLMSNFESIRTYDGVAADLSGKTVKFDITPYGFHAMILSPGGQTVFIDPISTTNDNSGIYRVYLRNSFATDKTFICHNSSISIDSIPQNESLMISYGNCTKRTYRLALAATGEYTAFHGGSVLLAQAAQVTTINRVNGIFNRDLAVNLTIIPNNGSLIYTNSLTDPYTNGNTSAMITENQSIIDSIIGSNNYDIGHVFGTNSGGLAGLGVVCNSNSKAKGVTANYAPIGDPFDVDMVCHEIGHQFGGHHSFRGNVGSCNGNAHASAAMEPGSGTTIMAYAGICGAQNIQLNTDDYFHAISLQEMHSFITYGGGSSCPVATTIANQNAPYIAQIVPSTVIPAGIPFALSATATDPDGDIITYTWEQMDNGNSVQPPLGSSTVGPNFRSSPPSLSGTRYFPSIASIVAGGPFTWEVLPSVPRTLNFTCVARDNHFNGGCNDVASVVLTTAQSTGVYAVSYPTDTGVSWAGNTQKTITWDVGGTDLAPFSCSHVDILLSIDSGHTFTTIVANVLNDGSQVINVPNTATANALIMVQCSNGTFFDISNNFFEITPATNDYTLSVASDSLVICPGSMGIFKAYVGQIGSYSSPVNLSLNGLPPGTVATFISNPVLPGDSVQISISGTSSTAPGVYTLLLSGTSQSGTHSTMGNLIIASNPTSQSVALFPSNGSSQIGLSPTLSWANSGFGLMHDLLISTNPSFSGTPVSISGLKNTSRMVSGLLPLTTYYWKIITYNPCSSFDTSNVYSFTTTSCVSYSSTNVPVVIPSIGTPNVTSALTISNSGIISDLDVIDLIGTHTWINDLTVKLTSPSGTQVTLWSAICNNEDNFDINFDDEANSGILPCPPTGGGTFIPNQLLSAFDGENMLGTWTLSISDAYPADGGMLSSWGLKICTQSGCTPYSYQSNVSACNSYTWVNGVTYTASTTTPTYTYTAANGCDSVVTLNLSILPAKTGIASVSSCNSYTWVNGVTYTASTTTPTYTYTAANGCDSVVTLSLVINTNNSGIDSIIACESHLWIDGNTYTSNNFIATHTLTNVYGCDSVVTLALTIHSIDETISLTGLTIHAIPGYDFYQWVECTMNGLVLLSGETNDSILVTTNGDYAVLIQSDGCSDTSICLPIRNVGLGEDVEESYSLQPNPSFGPIKIRRNHSSSHSGFNTIEIFDSYGRRIMHYENVHFQDDYILLDLESLPSGVYLLSLSRGKVILREKISILH